MSKTDPSAPGDGPRAAIIRPVAVGLRIAFLVEVCAGGRSGELARMSGVAPSAVSNAMNPGRLTLSQESGARIAEACGASTDFIFTGRRRWLSDDLHDAIDAWIARGDWDLLARAPKPAAVGRFDLTIAPK